MNDFFRRKQGAVGLESELVRQRPTPRDEFLGHLVRTVEARRPARNGRMGTAIALAGVVLVALGASGGTGYAYSSASTAVGTIASAVHLDQSGRVRRPATSAGAQYTNPVPVPPFPSTTPTTPTTPGTGGSTGGGGTGGGSTGGGGTTGGGGGNGTGAVAGESASESGNTGNTGTSGIPGPGAVAGQANQSGGLPFTGLSLLIPVLLGAGLIAAGVIIRRLGRSSPRYPGSP